MPLLTNSKIISEIKRKVELYYGLSVSDRLMREILAQEWPDYVKSVQAVGEVETCVAEAAAGAIGRYVVGKPWPSGDTDNVTTTLFFATLYVKAPGKGIKVLREIFP